MSRLLFAVAALSTLQASRAATVNSWAIPGTGSWNTGTNWSTTAVPNTTEAATFTSAINTATNVITLDGNQAVYGVNLVTTTGGKAVQIDPGTGGTLTVVSTDQTTDGNSTFQALSVNSGLLIVNVPVQLGDGSTSSGTATFNNNSTTSTSFDIRGNITEAAGQVWGVRITGTGANNAFVTYSTNAKNYSGDTTVANNGVLRTLLSESIPNGAGKGNVVLEGTGQIRLQLAAGAGETINGLSSTSGSSQVQLTQNNSRTLTVGDNNASGNFAGQINETTGTFGLTKIGTGTQSISTSNGSGVYTVSAGTLLVNGDHTPRQSNNNGYSVAANATLGGTGTINRNATPGLGVVLVNGTVAPGANGVGTLTINTPLTLSSSSFLSFQLDGAAEDGGTPTVGGTSNDLIHSTTLMNLTLDGTLNVTETVLNSFLSAQAGDQWRLITYTGTLVDNVLELGIMPALQSGLQFQIVAGGGQVNLVVASMVPEPRAYLFGGIACGLMCLTALRRTGRTPALAVARA